MKLAIFGAAALSAIFFANAAQAFSPDMNCASEPRMRSQNSDVEATLTFTISGENDETQARIYWLDFDGNRKLYKHMFGTESWTVNTYLTHPWIITYPEPGGGEYCGGIVLPQAGRRTVSLD